MAYTFQIHKGSSAQEDGWQISEELKKGSDNKSGIGSIDDSIEGGNAGKVGTSIPTPFARIYLFDTAFAFVATNRANREPNFYDQLVTQSLDLLQLLFEKGADDRLKLYEWDGKKQVEELDKKGFKEGHKTLATALNTAINSNEALRHIVLIEYDGVLLGGTSPMTVVYTSPNAVRLLMEKNIELLANDKSPLFKERSIKHLKDRSPEFQKYVAWLLSNYNREFTGDNSPLISFYNYADSQFLMEDVNRDELVAGILEDNYKRIRRRNSEGSMEISLSVFGDLVLRYNDAPMDMSESDFLMRPSIQCYGNSNPPVVLPTDGDSAYDGWKFTQNEKWQSLTTMDYFSIMGTKIEDRYLPTIGAHNRFTSNHYPWLTTGDFFENDVILLSYNLNVSKFYFPTLAKGGYQFLLPIRKEYFKYFTLEDLRQYLKAEVSVDPKNEKTVRSISFELKVPLRNRESITLRRTYTLPRQGDTPACKIIKFKEGMSFGIFPFYRCPVSEDKKNEYSIYLYGSAANTNFARLEFYQQDREEKALVQIKDSDTAGKGDGVIRTSTSEAGYSRIYNLRNETTNSFDAIEISLNDGKQIGRALAVPMWKEPPIVNNNKESIISIDFGTSNTYVSYLDESSAHPLTISPENQQMVLLNDSSKKHGTNRIQYRNNVDFGDALYMDQFLREFVPSSIGVAGVVDEEEYIGYPIKTATLEKQNFDANGKLFSDINIGFNIDNEKTAVETARFRYVTDLKWSAEEHKGKQDLGEFNKDKCRIRAFCDQTLWMIKNALVLEGFSTDIKMVYFYPDSMSKIGREIFKTSWEESIDNIFRKRGFNVKDVKSELEAISPYYSLLILHSSIYSKSTANIDVGGGTTDYFILDQTHMSLESGKGAEDGKAYEASIFFAGNDLWGATYPQSQSPGTHQKNGFVSYMKTKIGDCSQAAQEMFKAFDSQKGMADFSGFFFKNDNLFNFSDLVSNHEKFRFVIFLHYAAIIYYFTDMLKLIKAKDASFTYPEILTFTGKGSEYVWMIAKEEGELSHLTTDLIRAFGIPDIKNIKIIRVDNPKALTADGGIYEMMSDSSLRINLFDKDKYGAEMNDKRTNTPYERIGKECLGFKKTTDVVKNADVATETIEKAVMNHFIDFAQTVFYSQNLDGTRHFLKFNLSKADYDLFIKEAEASYKVHAKRFVNNNLSTSDQPLEESIFFFTLKNALINMSIHYFENN